MLQCGWWSMGLHNVVVLALQRRGCGWMRGGRQFEKKKRPNSHTHFKDGKGMWGVFHGFPMCFEVIVCARKSFFAPQFFFNFFFLCLFMFDLTQYPTHRISPTMLSVSSAGRLAAPLFRHTGSISAVNSTSIAAANRVTFTQRTAGQNITPDPPIYNL